MSDRPTLQRVEVWAKYLETLPTLVNGKKNPLLLTVDGKLLTYDPDTYGAIADLITRAKGLDDIHDDLAIVDGNVDDLGVLLGHADFGLEALKGLIEALEAERGTDDAALAVTLEDAMQKATGPAWNQDTDSLEAIREVCDSIVTAMS